MCKTLDWMRIKRNRACDADLCGMWLALSCSIRGAARIIYIRNIKNIERNLIVFESLQALS